jgi:hypothetical protein
MILILGWHGQTYSDARVASVLADGEGEHVQPIDRIKSAVDLPESSIKFIVRPDPHPLDHIPISLAHRSELIVDPHRPHVVVPLQLFESERRMLRVHCE